MNITNSLKIYFLIWLIINLQGCGLTELINDESFDPQLIIPLELKPIPKEKLNNGNPRSYIVYGEKYQVLKTSKDYKMKGGITIYPQTFNNETTTSGEKFNIYKLTAANRTLPIPCYVNVLNLSNGKSINVLVNDRGPYDDNAILSISPAAAYKLDIQQHNVKQAKVQVIGIKPYTDLNRKKYYYLQLAIFKTKEKAEKVKSYLRTIFSFNNTNIVKLTLEDSYIYAIEIGPFTSKPKAKKYMNQNLNSLPMLPAIIEK